MFSPSWLELSENSLKNNLKFLKKVIGEKVKLSCVIKGNAYGHSIKSFLPLAEKLGVDHFSVFDANEALLAKKCSGENSHIMIMGYIDDDQLSWAVENNISFYIFDTERLKKALIAARKLDKQALIHLEIETGLNRTGLTSEQIEHILATIKNNRKRFSLEGITTHYAGAESVNNYLRIQGQIKRFQQAYLNIVSQGLKPKFRHTACSAAALTYPETIMDMVRFGIAVYGFWPSRETMMPYYLDHLANSPDEYFNPLERVLSWKSRIMNIKRVKPGEFIGYGTTYQTDRTQLIAAVPVGYFHGFARSLSNLGHVIIRGRRTTVVGTVNMNMILADVTDIKNVKRGDEVVIIGRQKKEHITVSSFSEMTKFLNYEVLVRIPSELKRVIVA